MPDITMCTNNDCEMSYSCWRFNCPPREHGQSYASFEPKVDTELDEVECDLFIEFPRANRLKEG